MTRHRWWQGLVGLAVGDEFGPEMTHPRIPLIYLGVQVKR